jgi:DNA helicase HerA-like ATPase
MPDGVIVVRSGGAELRLLSALANRHGCITGATGTGKTVTLQGLAEGEAEAEGGGLWAGLRDVLLGTRGPRR